MSINYLIFFLTSTSSKPEKKLSSTELLVLIVFAVIYAIAFIIVVLYLKKHPLQQRRRYSEDYIKPLTDEELKLYQNIMVRKYIKKVFKFKKSGIEASNSYKKSLNANGRLDRIDLSINQVPIFLTSLLKHKRHEWVAYVFCDIEKAKYIWTNKGQDNTTVSLNVSIESVVDFAIKHQCTTIIKFHNHPHTADRWWDLLSPSQTDLNTADYMSDYLYKNGITLISGLCTQGEFIIYDYQFHDNSLPKELRMDYLKEFNQIASTEQHIEMHKTIHGLFAREKAIKLKVTTNR